MKITNKDSLKLFCLVVILAIALPAHAKKDQHKSEDRYKSEDRHKSGPKIHAWEVEDTILHHRIDAMQLMPGPAGLPGADGAPGTAGNNGAKGADGTPGPMGPAGNNGVDGDPGIDGLEGLPGADAPDRTTELCALYNVLFDARMIYPLEVPEYCSESDKPAPSYTIGSRGPGGGIVFYVTEAGLHGLEAAPADQSAAAEWGCYTIPVPGADGSAIGTGAQNTADIIAAGCMVSSAGNTAAQIVDEYVSSNGYSDWFLPSRDELNRLFINKDTVGGFPATDNTYWSSSEGGNNFGVYQIFTGGTISTTQKFKAFRVRAVRAF